MNETAAAYINGEMPAIYATNYNSAGDDIASQVKGYSFELVDAGTVKSLATKDETLLPYKVVDGKKDVRWNTRAVNSEIMQGILQGDSIPKISDRLTHVTEMNLTSAVRNARTATTSAQNRGRMDSYHKAQEKGIRMVKVWLATGDARTRDAHFELNGQERDIDEPFENSLGKIMYPGDPDADPANVYNCRCTLITRVVGFTKEAQEEEPELEVRQEKQGTADEEKTEAAVPAQAASYAESLVGKEYSPHIAQYKTPEEYWEAKREWQGEQTKYLDDVFEYGKFEPTSAWTRGGNPADIPKIEGTIADLSGSYPATSSGEREYGTHVQRLKVCDYESAWLYLPNGEADRRLTDDAAAQVFFVPDEKTAVIAFRRGTMAETLADSIKTREEAIESGGVLSSIGFSPEVTTMHEWGHVMSNHLDNAMIYQDEKVVEYWEWYKSLSKDEIREGLSDYATTNRGEFEAECFAELQMPNPRPLALKFKEYLDEVIKRGY